MQDDSRTVTTWYLEMRTPEAHRPARPPRVACSIDEVTPPDGAVNRELYIAVGSGWEWRDRLPWTQELWQAYAANPGVRTFVCHVKGKKAGYVELQRAPDAQVEVAYFGLLPDYLGLGLGGHLLSFGIDVGFQMGAARLWVHTCTLDAPQALGNYQARGFRIYDSKEHTVSIPSGTEA